MALHIERSGERTLGHPPEKTFRRVKGYRELELLHRRMNPSLTQQAQVA
ncbi:MAG: hypothetical protein ACYDDI_01420 [Candidatus Acidiferrales bacterium]